MTVILKRRFKIPGKIVLNGGYLVCLGDEAISITTDCYLNVSVNYNSAPKFDIQIFQNNKKENLNNKNFFSEIIAEFFRIVNQQILYEIKIELNWDEGFFVNDIKTGLGSSACLILAISKCLYDILDNKSMDLLTIAKRINTFFIPLTSNIDVTSCYKGNIIYSKQRDLRLKVNGFNILIGSMLKSQKTENMLHLLNSPERFSNLSRINKEINKSIKLSGWDNLKPLYCDYLLELKSVNDSIVPLYQYSVLKKTFDLDVVCCGVSGSGGEDAVWCLVKDGSTEEVLKVWRQKFLFVKQLKLLEKGGLIEL